MIMYLENIRLSAQRSRKRIGKAIIYIVIGRGLKICLIGIALGNNLAPITVYDMIDDLVTEQSSSLLPSYTYIDVHYNNISTDDKDYPLIQKAIFLGIIPNKTQSLNLSRTVSRGYARRLLEEKFSTAIDHNIKSIKKISQDERETMLSHITANDANTINVSINHQPATIPTDSSLNPIFYDVYDKIKHEFLTSGNTVPSDDLLIQGAIKGMTQAIGDQHSSYFIPTASKNFSDSIQGEFYGIGAYIDTKEPGILMISSTIANSPATKAGVRAGDYITAIDDYTITVETDPDDAISKIKGPKGTSVILTILRGGETKTITIVRDKISIKPIESINIDKTTVLIQINSFAFGSDTLRSQMMDDVADKGYQKVIIDLRYNPGGSLDDVAHMLDYIVPKGKPTVIIRSRNDKEIYTSNGVDDPSKSLSTKKVIVLINKESASASEILAGVIRDYLPNAQIVGETSYGKGSIQSLRDYNDGSSLKLTTAKRYTGKSDTTIDHKGIVPDIFKVDDPKTDADEVLDRAKRN